MLSILVAAGAAMAQSAVTSPEIDAQTFRPSLDGTGTLLTDDASFSHYLRPSARLLFQYVNDPLVYVDNGEQTRVVSDIVQADALLGLAIDRVRVGVDVPVYLWTDGLEGQQTGLGDVGAELRLGFLDPERAPLGLALHGRLDLPTATVAGSLGSGGLGYEAGGILDVRTDATLVALNVGTRGKPEVDLGNVVVGDELYARLGVAQAMVDDDSVGLSAEAAASWTYGEPLDNRAALPVEVLGGGWLRGGDFALRVAAGLGVTDGVGAPDARALLSLGYEPPLAADRDRDGISDSRDSCPSEAEDVDGYKDKDGCPDPSTAVRISFVDEAGQPVPGVRLAVEGGGVNQELPTGQALLHPGRYELRATAEGFVPLESPLEVPAGGEHAVSKVMTRPSGVLEIRVVGPDGQPIDARLEVDGGDRGRTSGQAYQLKVNPGVHQVRAMANGYRLAEVELELDSSTREQIEIVMEPSRVVVTVEKVELREKVLFDTNATTIKPASYPLLDDVVQVMRDHPEISLLRIEGHTDERGDDDYNQKLSEGRAEAIRQYLVEHGVAAERLRSVGHGETKPLDPASTEDAWEKNRRVEMWIEGRSDD